MLAPSQQFYPLPSGKLPLGRLNNIRGNKKSFQPFHISQNLLLECPPEPAATPNEHENLGNILLQKTASKFTVSNEARPDTCSGTRSISRVSSSATSERRPHVQPLQLRLPHLRLEESLRGFVQPWNQDGVTKMAIDAGSSFVLSSPHANHSGHPVEVDVEGINPAPHIHEQMATSNYV